MATVTIDEIPELLQIAVKEHLETFQSRALNPELLTIEKWEGTIYKDKSIVTTIYSAYIQTAIYMNVLKISLCSKPEWSDTEVDKSGMNIGDIVTLIHHSDWLRSSCKNAIAEIDKGASSEPNS